MSNERVRYTITTMPITGRFRGQIWVDDHATDKAFFSSYNEADMWCRDKVAELREIVR